jgi:Zn-dependent peptidase ImmA (M78 family)
MANAPIQHWRELKGTPEGTPAKLRARFGRSKPPIDPYAIAAGLGVEVRHITDRKWSGAVKFIDDRAVIWLNDGTGRRRKRFTLAHELGHLMLHGHNGRGMYRDLTFDGTAEERAANEFAAALLMPAQLVRKYAILLRFDLKRLANLFDVSLDALNVRLAIMAERKARAVLGL